MRIEAGPNRILCIEQEKPKTTEAGIHIVETPQSRPPYIAGVIIESTDSRYPEGALAYFYTYCVMNIGPNKIYAVKIENIECCLHAEETDLQAAKEEQEKSSLIV